MKVICALVSLLLFAGGGYTAPSGAPDQGQPETEVLPVDDTEDKGQQPLSNLPKPGDGKLIPEFASEEPLADKIDGNEEGDDNKELEDISYVSANDEDDISEYSMSYPSWLPDGFFTSINDVDAEQTEEAILDGIEAALVNEKIEPLYRSISRLKSLLHQLREKASQDLESASGEESFYSSSGESYDDSATQGDDDLDMMAGNGYGAVSDDRQRFPGQVIQGNQEVPKNGSKAIPKNNAIESAMNNVPETYRKANHIKPGRRFKRDLGWGRRGKPRYNNLAVADADDDSISSAFADESVDGDSALESSWMSSSDAGDSVLELNDIGRKPLNFQQRIEIKPREETNWRKVFLNLRGRLGAPIQRLDRRRRNKEDLKTFLNSMPTLEGLRKRTLIPDEDEDEEYEIPDPGPFYPEPLNLPPPDNVIRPELPPDDTLPWELPPDFDEDNALLEEQTNGLDMINHYNKRYRYLRDVERSIMDESLEDLALQLAGRQPSRSNALRVRRVMQIPPPPPYGRKVVKSLYRKKAYGYPFMADEFADELIPNSWESGGEDFSQPYNAFNPQDLDEPHSWGEYLQFGRIEGPDEASDMVSRLMSAIKTKEAKDTILEHLLHIRDASPELQREILLQALMAEADPVDGGPNNAVGYDNQQFDSDENTQWGNFKSNEEADDDGENAISDDQTEGEGSHDTKQNDAVGNTVEVGGWDSSLSGEDKGTNEAEYFSDASESDASVPDWEDIPDELQSNIPQLFEEMKQQILIQKLAEFLQRTASSENRRI
ncbi:uncharacterized protein LOC121413694 [Lytechinus variegatus]|uniref:uncharacterized protein LOC121413694 n=1 Tax=Lytechinus variegatus TaxID=7654 RepID=UPI001BB1C6B8|nr:uncharacterized protein LOC121413694 [Lytechinus variegatus]